MDTGVTTSPQQSIVAAVQFEPKLLDVRGNIAVAQQLVFEAAAKGARVIVLPESCMGGAVLETPREAADVAQEKDGYQTQSLIPLCQRFSCRVVLGYTEVSDGRLYNSAAVIGPMGIEANAQKHNLWGSENLWAQPSEQLCPIVVTETVGRLGVLICRDAMNRYRESYRHYRSGQRFYKQGHVDTIALLTNWGGSYGFPDASWVELVEETRANLIVSNRIGSERDIDFKGGSCIIDRDRRIWTYGSSFNENAVVGGVVLV